MRPCVLVVSTLFLWRVCALSQQDTIDFRYAPSQYFAAICFPDDWQKTVVTHTGALGFDFGPGPYARPLTEISFGIKEEPLKVVSQSFSDVKIPHPLTEYAGSGVTLATTAFACVPARQGPPKKAFHAGNSEIERLDGLQGCVAWATPNDTVESAFRTVAWGVNRPIHYRVRVPSGSTKVVALGLCEPYKPGPGARVLEFHVEGSETRTADPLAHGIKNSPSVYVMNGGDTNRDGWLDIECRGTVTCPDPNTILNVLWVFPEGYAPDQSKLIRGLLNKDADVFWDCGREAELQAPSPRYDVLHARFTGGSFTPIVRITSRRPVVCKEGSSTLTTEGIPFLTIVPTPTAYRTIEGGWELELPSGSKEAAVVATHGWSRVSSTQPSGSRMPATLGEISSERTRAEGFWKKSPLPHGKILVPEPRVQELLDASIRNLYQIRERVNGLRQFQPGPSVYRGLWVHDAVWHVLAATMLADTAVAREAIEALLRKQEPDGRFIVMSPYPMNRETPLATTLIVTFARLTQNRNWLSAHWSVVEKGIEWLWALRGISLKDPTSIGYGLFPPGFADGGLGGVSVEYGSVYWALAGFRVASDGARWMGKEQSAVRWDHYYGETMRSFRAAASRDLRRDALGNTYLPMRAGDTSRTTPPQQANWGILEAQNYAHVFRPDDSLLTGTLATLRSGMKQGLAVNTGWLKDGLWPFFGMIQAMTHLEVGEYRNATQMFYAIANHASPLGTWVEEQLPRDIGTRTTGDGSNASASALFVQLVRRMMVNEKGDGLELLAGVPEGWLAPGAVIALNDVPTFSGPCKLRLEITPQGTEARLFVGAMGRAASLGGPRIVLAGLKRKGYTMLDGKEAPDVLEGRWGEAIRMTVRKGQLR